MLLARSCTPTCTCSLFICFSNWNFTGITATAVFGQVGDELIHVREIGGIDDEAPVLAAVCNSRARQSRQVERKRGWRKVELLADGARGHASRSRLHQQAEDRKARTLGQGAEGLNRLLHFHVSRIMEMKTKSKTLRLRPPCERSRL